MVSRCAQSTRADDSDSGRTLRILAMHHPPDPVRRSDGRRPVHRRVFALSILLRGWERLVLAPFERSRLFAKLNVGPRSALKLKSSSLHRWLLNRKRTGPTKANNKRHGKVGSAAGMLLDRLSDFAKRAMANSYLLHRSGHAFHFCVAGHEHQLWPRRGEPSTQRGLPHLVGQSLHREQQDSWTYWMCVYHVSLVEPEDDGLSATLRVDRELVSVGYDTGYRILESAVLRDIPFDNSGSA